MGEVHAALRVDLQMGIKIIITEWAGRSITITGDVRGIVRQSKANGDASAVIGGTDIPGVRRVSQESGAIGTSGNSRCGGGIAVVCRHPKPAEHSWQEG